MGSYVFPPNCSVPMEDWVPHLTHGTQDPPELSSQTHLDRFSRFCMGPKCYAVQCIVRGDENPQNCPLPWDFVTVPEEDRATAIDNMHTNLIEIARWFRIYPRGQTNTYTQTCSSQYFATAPASEVIMPLYVCIVQCPSRSWPRCRLLSDCSRLSVLLVNTKRVLSLQSQTCELYNR